MKFVLLKLVEGSLWDHTGAVEVEVDEQGLARSAAGATVQPQVAAAEQAGMAGVFVAVPFDDWVMLEAQAQITVTPLMRREQVEQREPSRMAPVVGDKEPGVDPELDGMVQGPKR